jgi:wyosine [tRNA(Phe)-imidazoG37] synthetase (radical SAM superfamily)
MKIDLHSSTAKGLADKKEDHGHRATYLGLESLKFPFSAENIRTMRQASNFSSEDSRIIIEMISSVEKTATVPFDWTPQEQFFIDNNSCDRVLPYLIYRFKFKVLPSRRIVTELPVHILIEPASICNLRCPMCFQTDRTFTRKGYMGTMELGMFRDIVDQAADGGTGAISIGSRGEPFLNRDLDKMLEYVSSKKEFFDLKVNTNVTRLNEKACHDLLSSSVNVITLSIDAYTKEIYEQIRVRGKFDQVLANVRLLHEIRARSYPNSKAEIRVSGVKFRADQDEAGFHDFWSDICDSVVYVKAQQRWNTYENPQQPDNMRPCDFLWHKLYVWYDGLCNPCDEDYKSYLSPGNIRDKSLLEIWGGPEMTLMRKLHNDGDRNQFNPCDRCGV